MGTRLRQPPFFSARASAPPYLARWHQAFAPTPDAPGPLVELWFDRDPGPPRLERVQLPPRGDGHVLAMAALYLAALVNNNLCVWGARRVILHCPDAALAHNLLHRTSHLLISQAEILTDLTPYFPLGLAHKYYGGPLVLDADPTQAARLVRRLAEPTPDIHQPSPPSRRNVLAINIGQHKTSCALVGLDGAGGYAVSRLHRQPTWPVDRPRCYPTLAPRILASLAEILGQLPPETEAVCLSLATPVLDGTPCAVPQIGLAADSSEADADNLAASLTAAVQASFPGLPVFSINDAAAQGLFASRFGQKHTIPTTNLLSLRLGACPSVSYIDASGRNLPRFNEYPWLVTRVLGPGDDHPLLSTISQAISFNGLGRLAHELGLLERYAIAPDQAATFFHRRCLEGTDTERHDALKLYYVLGAHIAMLAHEIDRHTPVRHVQLLGSDANRIDAPVFTAIHNGFAGFIERHGLPFASADFTLAEHASATAGLVGAAVGYDGVGEEVRDEERRCLRRPGA